MLRVFRRLIEEQKPLNPADCENFHAYRLALLAHSREIPCALLTNHRGLLAKGLTVADLCAAFHAEAVFDKEGSGLSECAAWVKKKLGLSS